MTFLTPGGQTRRQFSSPSLLVNVAELNMINTNISINLLQCFHRCFLTWRLRNTILTEGLTHLVTNSPSLPRSLSLVSPSSSRYNSDLGYGVADMFTGVWCVVSPVLDGQLWSTDRPGPVPPPPAPPLTQGGRKIGENIWHLGLLQSHCVICGGIKNWNI